MAAASNGWTGGQASLLRVLVGLVALGWLLVAWPFGETGSEAVVLPGTQVELVGALAPATRTVLRIAALVLAALLVPGVFRRGTALGLAGVWLVLHGAGALGDPAALPGFELTLLFVAFLPAAPYGSFAARNRADPGGGFAVPRAWTVVAWLLYAAGYVYAAVGLERADLPGAVLLTLLGLGFVARLRVGWTLILLFTLGWTVATGHDPSHGVVWLHLVTFVPAWVPSPEAGITRVFYDGSCGLCHRTVRLLLAEDPAGAHFRFAALGGETFEKAIPAAERDRLPDSLVVETPTDRVLVRSRAVRHCLDRLGGLWRASGLVLTVVPPPLLDVLYDGVARLRHRLFPRPEEACPVAPEGLRARFDP